ncbi:MAG: sodium:solute symporter [Bacteroidota bacterium]
MNSILLLIIVLIYFAALLVIAYYASKGATNESFFIGKKNSSWLLVAYGMIGTSLSGVTFMSVPGGVNAGHFGYLQVVIGYLIGYMVVAFVLLPLYYKLNLTSIYSYLENRFGIAAYKTGASFFILSRTLGATIRIYLVIKTLQLIILNELGIPFALTVFVILLMILLYTYKGGVKTIVITDTLQTTFMLLALIVTVGVIMSHLNFSFSDLTSTLQAKGYSQVFHYDWKAKNYFLKHIIGGMFITIAMTGLDQEMMQKNISCKSLGDAQKNMIVFSSILLFVNLLFLILGGVLYIYAAQNNIALPAKGDDLFPLIALKYLSPIVGLIFIIGLISALFPSADGALTALTSSVCIDLLNLKSRTDMTDKQKESRRITVHLLLTLLFFILIILCKIIDDGNILNIILTVAGYTYGPLLGLFAFGIITRKQVLTWMVPIVCVLSPIICYVLDTNSVAWFQGYVFGFELLFVNGLITFLGLYISSFFIKKQLETSIN